jgi:hypothetical protein
LKRHAWTLSLLLVVCAVLAGAGLSNGIAAGRDGAEPFAAFLGYGELLTVTDGMRDGERYDGFVDIAGSSAVQDVIVIVDHDGGATSRTVKMNSSADGSFTGRVWFVEGPGAYTLSVACRSPGASKYVIVCEAEVHNTVAEPPLVPLEYVGYSDDLLVYEPRGGSSKVVGGFVVRGWSRYPTVRAVVQSSAGPVLEYFAEAAADGSFELEIPLPAWMGRSEIRLCSKKIGPNTWRGAAVYRVDAVAAAVHADTPAYQKGLILATGPFEMSGRSESSAPMQVEVLDKQGSVVAEPVPVAVRDSRWSATVTPPEGLRQFQVRIASTDRAAASPEIAYSVAVVDFEGGSGQRTWSANALVQSVAAQINASVPRDTITEGVRDYYLLKAVHDWVATNTRYDVKGARSGRPGPGDAVTTLVRGEGVCLGYANLTSAILDCLGIENRVVLGMADNGTSILRHAWNEAVVGGRVVFMDVTWDSGTTDGQQFEPGLKWQYFDPDPEKVAFSHFPDLVKR